MSVETSQMVTASQLKRSAFLYVRQSTPRQVLEHTESTARQYALRKRAVALGWQDDQRMRVTLLCSRSPQPTSTGHPGWRINRNPRYAGAFFYGRTRFHKKIDGGGRVQRLPRQEWHTLILDAHPGYITWQDYEENLRRLQENAQIKGVEKRSAPREGPSLLQGLVICGICGSRMTVGYRQRKAGLAPDYICPGPREVDRIEKGYCQRISGYSLDIAVGALLVDTVSPLALEVALSVQQEMQSRWDEADRLRRPQVDRARYESDLARRRFLRVDPDNRLVAASLEAEWNAKLRALSEAEQNYDRQRQADQFKISVAQREQALALATNFPRLWNDPGTANRERKRMVRLLIEDITIRKGGQVQLDVRFRGGASKTLMVPRPLSFCESHKQNPAMVAEMDRLLEDYNYADTARILNESGFKTGDGLPLTSIAVGYVRKAYGLKSRFDRLRERGMLTVSEIATACGVSINTIGHWRQKG